MKVYVDELPQSCGDCIFCKQTEYYYYCDKLHTKLGYIDREKECPLKSLTEHNKEKDHQIELLNKRWEMLKEYIKNQRDENGSKYFDSQMIEDDDILDKMQELEQELKVE